jgi:hypothetical protein
VGCGSPTRQRLRTLTPMTAIRSLVEKGDLLRIEVELAPHEQPRRLLYGTPNFVHWLEARMGSSEPSPGIADLTPAEQLDALFHAYLSGEVLDHTRQFRIIRAEANAVWELKTPDLRIFGWFAMKDCFVAVFGAWADRVKDFDLYRGYRLEVRRIRRELGVGGSLCVQGVVCDDVISV